MKERPILFSAPMVCALLAGTKTQTRRLVKPQPVKSANGMWNEWRHKGVLITDQNTRWSPFEVGFPDALSTDGLGYLCPYGQVGDRLWVRETWQGPLVEEFESDADSDWMSPARIHQYQNPAHCQYAADGGPAPEFMDADDNLQRRWKPGIHMFRWASRILLEITEVRVEHLQDISEADAMAEGVVKLRDDGYGLADTTHYHFTDPRQSYFSLWEAINGPGSVEANPWLWVVKFSRPA